MSLTPPYSLRNNVSEGIARNDNIAETQSCLRLETKLKKETTKESDHFTTEGVQSQFQFVKC